MEKLKLFSPVVVRVGLALVFVWFGVAQLTDTNSWTAFVPDFIVNLSSMTAATIVHLNGAFEIIFGAALLLGFFTRFVSFFLALHMLDIMFTVGYNSIGVRDFGLAVGTIAIWFHGADVLTLDRFLGRKYS